MIVIIVICWRCGKVLQDIPPVFKKNPSVDIEIVFRVCREFCDGRLKMLREMGKRLENQLNKEGGVA
jgi:hypothetical protein